MLTIAPKKKVETVNHFKKSASEKALAKVAKQQHQKNRKKLDPSFTKRKGNLGLKTNKIWELAELVRLGEQVLNETSKAA